MRTCFFIKSSFLNSFYLETVLFKKINSSFPFFILIDEELLPAFSFLHQNEFKNTFISFENHYTHFFNNLLSDSVDYYFNDSDVFDLFLFTLKNKYNIHINSCNHTDLNLSFSLEDPSETNEIHHFVENFFIDSNFFLETQNDKFTISHHKNENSFLYRIHNDFEFEKIFFFIENENIFHFQHSVFHPPYYSFDTLFSFQKNKINNLSDFFNKND